ncbi:MAG: tRNA (adenosine(37)-N6)-threonylcarbamoyltransferase complex transferase subunit TsaD [Acidimicrobiia bacterium]|nr:tRNA (adenosine(37)-N6)-threonylcarbamoyltransferase complex transferase subunit TsaD [Acidimicrobiia bacterium]
MPLILGIETSCDETAAAVVEDGRLVRSSIVWSQHETHAPFGGVVPELAARAHVERIDTVVTDALVAADTTVRELDAVAVTHGPGLAGALLVGVAAAKGVAVGAGIPLVAVNHLEAHVHANAVDDDAFAPPAIALLVSGGHTMLLDVTVAADGTWEFDLVGQSVDDAAGEAYDKVARFLGLGYPGGPEIDALAATGDPEAVVLPRAMRNQGYDFSFSGLKTAVVQAVRRSDAAGTPLPPRDVAAGFQAAAVDVLVDKTVKAARERGRETVVIAGGVAANSRLRAQLASECEAAGLAWTMPSVPLCQDNAVMVAACADRPAEIGRFASLDVGVEPSLAIAKAKRI